MNIDDFFKEDPKARGFSEHDLEEGIKRVERDLPRGISIDIGDLADRHQGPAVMIIPIEALGDLAPWDCKTTFGGEEDLFGWYMIPVLIDLRRPGKMKKLQQLVKHYSRYVPTDIRSRGPEVDVWKVHDLHKAGLNPTEIARKLFPDLRGLKAEDERVKNARDRVESALKFSERVKAFVKRFAA